VKAPINRRLEKTTKSALVRKAMRLRLGQKREGWRKKSNLQVVIIRNI
jgi:hypothetical protein